MKTTTTSSINRRNFLRTSAAVGAGLTALGFAGTSSFASAMPEKPSDFVIGPLEGYTPQVGTLVSMLNYNRMTIVNMVKGMTMAQLDHLHDATSNSIGALVLHLGAVETFYQANTFEGRQDLNDAEKKEWNAAMELGDLGRREIKGKEATYYIERITTVREKTLQLLKKKDDQWLLAIDPEWSKEAPLNTYWKWFHVCEHESNHRGQIAFLRSRLPGAKPSKE